MASTANITRFLTTPAGQVAVVAAIAAGVVWYGKRQAVTVAQAVNPVSDENIFYQGVNGIGSALTGSDSFDLGGWIYDITHGSN